MVRRIGAARWIVTLALTAAVAACGGGDAKLTELQKVRSGAYDVVLLSPHEALRHGNDRFVVEFRTATGALVDAGEVKATASMPMAGTPMFGRIDLQRTEVPGRYRADGEFSMAGTWRVGIEYDGPAGKGAVTFSGNVQ